MRATALWAGGVITCEYCDSYWGMIIFLASLQIFRGFGFVEAGFFGPTPQNFDFYCENALRWVYIAADLIMGCP